MPVPLISEWYDQVENKFLGKAVGGAVYRAGEVTKIRAQRVLVDEGRVGTGALINSMRVEVRRTSKNRWSADVSANTPYAIYQHEGIGPVVPKRAKALRFKPKGSVGFVFAKRVKGFKGAKYLTEALSMLDESDFA